MMVILSNRFLIALIFCIDGFPMVCDAEETSYQSMNDFEVNLAESTSFQFEVRACNDVSLLLFQDEYSNGRQLYQIQIGGLNNTISAIHKENTLVAYEEHSPLDCDNLQPFWISWKEGVIRVGAGFIIIQNVFMSFHDSYPFEVKHLAVSPAYWVFNNFNGGFPDNKQRFCQGMQEAGFTDSGIYRVSLDRTTNISVYCDLGTDQGGWLVFQRRQDGSEDFYRGWVDYENGFGDLNGEFWLGNRILSTILSRGHFELRIDLEDWKGNKRYAKYHTFIVRGSCDNYRLTVFGYSGDAGDSMAVQNDQDFTTKDNDNDANVNNCAVTYKGAWWYSGCHYSNLNGLYLKGNHSSPADGIEWYHWTGYYYSLKKSEMKIREICKH